MGAEQFFNQVRAKSAKEAFDNAVAEARLRHGTEPYSGTIKEKDGFTLVAIPEGLTAERFVEATLDGHDPSDELPYGVVRQIQHARRIADDKWGPAVAIEIPGSRSADGTAEFALYGWASS